MAKRSTASLTMIFIDANIIIRFLTGDDPEKQAHCASLFERIEKGESSVFCPDLVVAECVFVLTSSRLYNLSREKVATILTQILHLSHFEVQNRQILLNALALFSFTKLDFADVYIIATMEEANASMEGAHITTPISYDHDFDDYPFIRRKEPMSNKPAKKAA